MGSEADAQPMLCAQDGCTRDAAGFTLYRVNVQGEPGVFMCRSHWRASTS